MKFLKNIIKSGIYSLASQDVNSLYKVVQGFDIVSFDIFDTLIKRNVNNPKDIFLLIDSKYNSNRKEKCNYYHERINAEIRARNKKISREVTLSEIYKEMQGFSKQEKKQLELLEVEIELNMCCPYQPLKQVYDWCRAHGKKVILISDMYLSSEQISKMLENCGYGLSDGLYVSSEKKCNKTSGELFKLAISENKGKKDSWIHIGDSIKGDYFMSKTNSIHSTLIKRNMPVPQFYGKRLKMESNSLNRLEYGMLKSYIQNHEIVTMNEFEKIGYEILGPILLGFSCWLHKSIIKNSYDKVLFLSRDSRLLQNAYELLFPESAEKNTYFYTSRKAALSAVTDLIKDFSELRDLFVPRDSATIADLCNKFNLSEFDICEIERELSCSRDLKINRDIYINKNKLFTMLLERNKINSMYQRELLLRYFDSLGIKKTMAIVDIGWEGRTEWAFKRACDESGAHVKIDGYYVGVITKCPDLMRDLNMFSFWGKLRNTDRSARIIMESIALFESLFLTSEGSTIEYAETKDGKVYPVKTEPDQIANNRENLERMQKSALQFISDIHDDNLVEIYSDIDPLIYLGIYENFAIRPSMKTVKLLKNLKFRDDGIHSMGSERNLFFYMLNPKVFLHDIWKSYYRILFLRDLFKLPLPYFELLYRFYLKQHKED